MDKYGNVYRESEDTIPEVDRTRLEGYLIAKAEQGEMERQLRKVEEEYTKLKNDN